MSFLPQQKIKDFRHMESVKFINEKFEEMKAYRKEKERQVLELKNEEKYLNEKVDRSLNDHEQYYRRNCLLIHGSKENENEDTNEVVIQFFEKERKEKLSANDIDRPHWLEKKKQKEVDLGLLSSNLLGTISVM